MPVAIRNTRERWVRLRPDARSEFLWSNYPNECLNREIRRRADVVRDFSDRDSIIQVVGAELAEQRDERAEGPATSATTSSTQGWCGGVRPRESGHRAGAKRAS
ncbi:transposase [Nocardioides marmoriginsengisoli]|uniref:transposase n=1 Tax=Nocardioides marmoriginsengisoli TaxID=661483 RepID=UPI001C83689F